MVKLSATATLLNTAILVVVQSTPSRFSPPLFLFNQWSGNETLCMWKTEVKKSANRSLTIGYLTFAHPLPDVRFGRHILSLFRNGSAAFSGGCLGLIDITTLEDFFDRAEVI